MVKRKNISMGKGEKTTLSRANDKSYSLRTTVPKGILNHFDLKAGDHLLWVIKPMKNGKGLMIVIEPEKSNKNIKKG